LKVRQEGFASAPAHLAGHSDGWKRVLGWLQSFLERGETVEARKETTHA